jgi:hypothetical protein
MSITCVSVLVAAAIFDPTRLAYFRWSWGDLFMIGWLLAPIPSAAISPFGLYEGISGALNQIIGWGLPYLIGRLYFSDAESLRELCIGFFVGGLVYLPLVLFEVRMSPQLHTWIYGFYQHSFSQTKKGDSFRATVFMQHGLAVAMFMSTAAVCGAYLWYQKQLKPIYEIPAWATVSGVVLGTLLCRSTYSIMLMISGIGILIASDRIRTKWIFLGLALIPPLYMAARTVGNWDAQILRNTAAMIGEDRVESLEVRLGSEEALWRWIQGSVVFGRARLEAILQAPREVYGRFVPDGFWLIALGKFGMVGLVSVFGALLAPCYMYLSRFSVHHIFSARMVGSTCLCMILVAYALDNLLNAMLNPMYLLAAGGLLGMRSSRE